MKLILSFLIVQLSMAAHPTYYPTESLDQIFSGELRDRELKEELFIILHTYHKKNKGRSDTLGCKGDSDTCYRQKVNSYKEARRYMFGDIDLYTNSRGEHAVKDVYCNQEFTRHSSDIGRLGPNQIPNHEKLNCEHTWPQSKFTSGFSKGLQKGDLHHLFPTDTKANSLRSSFDFGYAPKGKSSPNCSSSRLDKGKFEPPHEHKGNVARAMFYFSTRYKMAIKQSVEVTLKQWHAADPVDDAERRRNERIYQIQKNRNPFIDFPEFVEQIKDF